MIQFDFFYGLVQSTTNQLTCFSQIIASATPFWTAGPEKEAFTSGRPFRPEKPEVPLALLHNTKSCLVGLKLWGNSATKKKVGPKKTKERNGVINPRVLGVEHKRAIPHL